MCQEPARPTQQLHERTAKSDARLDGLALCRDLQTMSEHVSTDHEEEREKLMQEEVGGRTAATLRLHA